MVRRPNISLLERTVDLIYRVSGERRCRELVDRAVARFLRHGSRARIRKQLAAGARARAVRDLQLAEEWFALSDQQGP